MTPRPNVSDKRIPQIVEAALRLFARQGYEAAGVEEIAQAAHLSVGGVYWYFKSKDAILLAVVDTVTGQDMGAMRELLDQPGSVRDRLLHYTRADAARLKPFLPLLFQLYGLAGRDKRLRQKFHTYLAGYRELLAALVRQGIARGELRPVDPGAAALTLAAVYEGTLELALLDPQIKLEEAMIKNVELVLEGLCFPGS